MEGIGRKVGLKLDKLDYAFIHGVNSAAIAGLIISNLEK